MTRLARRGALDPALVRELFERSGYTALKSDLVLDDEWLGARWPTSLSHEAVYTTADGAVIGHVTVTRAYERTWLGHEIATRRDHPEALACRRALYHHFARWPRVVDGEEALLFGYYNRGRPWHRALFEDFAATSDPLTECLALPLDRFVTDGAPAIAESRGAGPTASDAAAGEREQAAALVTAVWPALAVRAFQLDAGHLTSECLHPEYRAAGLARRRHLLVLRDEGRLTGAAVCDTATGHLSLFNTLNSALLFFAPGATAAGKTLLVQRVRAFFAERGVPAPLFAATPGSLPGAPGLRLAETMGCIVWTARGLRAYDDYIEETMARYPLGAAPAGPAAPRPQSGRLPP